MMERITMLAMAAAMAVPGVGAAAQLTATLDQKRYVSGQEMHLVLDVQHQQARKLPLLRAASLDVDFLDVVVIDRATGQEVPPQVHRDRAMDGGDAIMLGAGVVLEESFNLDGRYPAGLAPGRYALSVEYFCPAAKFPLKSEDLRDVEMVAAPVNFEVVARDAAQEADYQRYLTILGGGTAPLRLEEAREALALSPAGLFARRIHVELAAALWQDDRLAEAAAEYRRTAGDKQASAATRDLCQQCLGLIYHQQGDLPAAIEAMSAVDTREARVQAAAWRGELNAAAP